MVRTSRTLLDMLLTEARLSADREICGLLLGNATDIVEARPVPNVAMDPVRSFEIDPAALFAALRAERAGGPTLIGHYHSHPNGSAQPSPRDLAAAEPGKLWLIIGGGIARLWLAEDGSFIERQLVLTD